MKNDSQNTEIIQDWTSALRALNTLATHVMESANAANDENLSAEEALVHISRAERELARAYALLNANDPELPHFSKLLKTDPKSD